jgi:hypothetical protein
VKNIIVNGKQYCEVSEGAAVDVTIPALKAELEALKDAIRWAFTDGDGSIRHVFHEAPGTDTDKIHAETLRKVLAGDARQIRRLDPDESIDYQEMLLAALNRGRDE